MPVYLVASVKTGWFMVGTAEEIAARRDYSLLDRHRRKHNRGSREMNQADRNGCAPFSKPYAVCVLDGDEVRAEKIREWLGRHAPKMELARENWPDGKFDLYQGTPEFAKFCRTNGKEWDGKTDAALLRMGGVGHKAPSEKPVPKVSTFAEKLAKRRS